MKCSFNCLLDIIFILFPAALQAAAVLILRMAASTVANPKFKLLVE